MQLSQCKPRSKPKRSRMKTLCTLDSLEPTFAESVCRRGKENDQRTRNCPVFVHTRHSTNKKPSVHQRSQFSAYNCSRVRENSNKKGQRAMSISHSSVNRIRTDHSEAHPNPTRDVAASLKKRLLFPSEDTYKFDCWQVVRTISETSHEEVLQGFQEPNKKEKCVMIKPKSSSLRRDYEQESKACVHVQRGMKAKEKNHFLKIRKVFREKKEWMVVTDNYYHASWENDQFYMFCNTLKTAPGRLQLVVKQVAQAIDLLSRHGFAHSALSIHNICFPLAKGELNSGEPIKLTGLRHCFRMEQKEAFLSLPSLFRTPPEILNFISFERKQEFERDYLDVIGKMEAGWQIDVWGLGILVLEILSGGPLSGEGSGLGQMMTLQKELPIRYSYLLAGIEGRLRQVLVQMLSVDPLRRPHPRQILRLL